MLLYASKYHDIKTVVNLSGRYDLKEGIEERLGKDYLERIRKEGFIDMKKRRSGNLSITLAYFSMPLSVVQLLNSSCNRVAIIAIARKCSYDCCCDAAVETATIAIL